MNSAKPKIAVAAVKNYVCLKAYFAYKKIKMKAAARIVPGKNTIRPIIGSMQLPVLA